MILRKGVSPALIDFRIGPIFAEVNECQKMGEVSKKCGAKE